MSNVSNATNATTPRPSRHFYSIDLELLDRLYKAYYGTTSFYIVVGTPLCVWFMAAILSSADMRKRLRNQLLCAICLSYMLKSTVTGSIEMSLLLAQREGNLQFNCYTHSVFLNLRVIFEFAGSWQVVILLLVYLAQVFDYDPTSTLTPMAVNMAKGALLVLPFVLAIILIPSVGLAFESNFSKRTIGCLIVNRKGYLVLRSLDYIVPVMISIVLLIIASVLYYRRYHRGFSTFKTMQTELMGRGRQVDNAVAYLVVVFLDIACRLPSALFLVEMAMSPNQRLTYTFVSWMVLDSRSIILPWGWLLLEDIRERIKIWRPWYRPAPGIDLAVTYSREENAGN